MSHNTMYLGALPSTSGEQLHDEKAMGAGSCGGCSIMALACLLPHLFLRFCFES